MKLFTIVFILFFGINSVDAQHQTCSDDYRLKVGLVLGGGGAKGASEVGVLKIIEKADIPIDYIAGTSIGSIIGALYSVGYRSTQLDSLFRTQEWLELFAKEVVTKDKMVELFYRLTNVRDSIDFNKMPIPFRCVATDIRHQKEIVLDHGCLPLAMRASMSIPGLFRPVKMDSLLLVDGGMLNNLPVDVVKQMGADVVIAIDLTQNKHESKTYNLRDRTGIGGILNWLVSRPDWKKYNDNLTHIDVYINPELKDYNALSFGKEDIDIMMEIGEKTAQKQLKSLKKLRQRIYNNMQKEH